MYRGSDLATIVSEHKDLAENEDIVVLRSSIDSLPKAAMPSVQEAPWRVSFVDGPVRYETWRGTGAILYVTTDGETIAYRGNDLDAIVAAHPELKARPEMTVVRRRITQIPEYRLRTQPYANKIERAAWLDMTVKPDTTDVVVYESTPEGTWSTHNWSGKDYRDIARAEADFRARGPLWFDLDFGASNAIGMYFITESFGGMFDGDITLSAGGATAELLTADLITTIDNLYEVYFLGIVDTAATFTSASVGNIGGGFFTYTVDDITTGRTTTANNAVPLPGTLALVMAGLVAWLPTRRR